MRRPRPIRRLVDGSPHNSGPAVARRTTVLLVPVTLVSNGIGALIVVVLVAFVLPKPAVADRGEVLLVNLAAVASYLVLAFLVGTGWGLRRLRGALAWLREDRAPTDQERRRTLRIPMRQLLINAALWLAAVVTFSGLNAVWSVELAIEVGVTALLGGVTTCATAYLLAERIARAASARALAHGVLEKPVLPGVTTRAVLAWALGSGVPILGIALVAIVALAGEEVGVDELAVTALALGAVVLVVGAQVTWQAARAIAEPVMSVREGQRRVEAGDLEAEVEVFDGSELGLLQAGFNRMGTGLREREELRDLFGRHVGEDVARAATERGIELGGEEREVAVLFVDLVGSTRLAAERSPSEVVNSLNAFFAVVVEVVESNGGWINKFVGDAALAVFGARYCSRYPAFLDCSISLMHRPARELQQIVSESVWLRLGQGMASCLSVLAGVLRRGAEQGVFSVEDPDYGANVLWTQGLGVMHLARIGVGVRQLAPGVPGLFAVAPEQIEATCVASALAYAGVGRS